MKFIIGYSAIVFGLISFVICIVLFVAGLFKATFVNLNILLLPISFITVGCGLFVLSKADGTFYDQGKKKTPPNPDTSSSNKS